MSLGGSMKRALEWPEDVRSKRKKMAEEMMEIDGSMEMEGSPDTEEEEFVLDENLLFEVFKHMDARTLGVASCVSRPWHSTATDERLWEIMCARQWANAIGSNTNQLRSVVLALGGFRRLHSLYLWPLLKPPLSSPSSSLPSLPWLPSPPSLPGFATKRIPDNSARLGKDEVHLSLSLLSIRYYEKMSVHNTQHNRNSSSSEDIVQPALKRLLNKDSN